MLEGLYMWAWVPYTYMDLMLHVMSLSWSIGLWTRWGDTQECLSKERIYFGSWDCDCCLWWVHLRLQHSGACDTLLITRGWFCGHICLFSQRGC
jgi:hypothetical protein